MSHEEIYEELGSLREQLDVERKAKEDAAAMLVETASRFKSLLVELWEGVRIHGLWAPSQGRDGERLIHAYCGGIVKAKERAEEAEAVRNTAIIRAEKAEADAEAMRATLVFADEVLSAPSDQASILALVTKIRKALASDAGNSVLEELKAAGRARDGAFQQLNEIDGALRDAGIEVKDENFEIAVQELHAERDALRSTIDAAKANKAGKLIFEICREFGSASDKKLDRIMDLTDQLAYAAHANGVRETEPLRAKQAETIQQMYYALVSARAAIKLADESPKAFAGGQADVTLRHIHKALALVDEPEKEADMTNLISALLEAPDTQLDAAMKPLIKKWQLPQPTPIQILEVLDHCINGSLASGFVVALLQTLYDSACKKAGTTHDEVAKLATWRQA